MNVQILIPARMASSRLPGKPLLDIGGKPMLVRVGEAALAAGLGEPVIAAGDAEIVEAMTAHGFRVLLTPPELPSGTDRIAHALAQLGTAPDVVINLQGDLPDIDGDMIRAVAHVLAEMPDADMATLVAPVTDEAEFRDSNVVKAALSPVGEDLYRALYFSRAAIPHGRGAHFHHIGIYGYRAEALQRFVSLPPSPLEFQERLEQLRALEAGMVIGAKAVKRVPIGVDSPADLLRARRLLER